MHTFMVNLKTKRGVVLRAQLPLTREWVIKCFLSDSLSERGFTAKLDRVYDMRDDKAFDDIDDRYWLDSGEDKASEECRDAYLDAWDW